MSRTSQPEGVMFGRRLRELRQKKRMTQETLAVTSGLTEAYISNMENGFNVPSLTTILRLARALDCKVTRLVSPFDECDLATIVPE